MSSKYVTLLQSRSHSFTTSHFVLALWCIFVYFGTQAFTTHVLSGSMAGYCRPTFCSVMFPHTYEKRCKSLSSKTPSTEVLSFFPVLNAAALPQPLDISGQSVLTNLTPLLGSATLFSLNTARMQSSRSPSRKSLLSGSSPSCAHHIDHDKR